MVSFHKTLKVKTYRNLREMSEHDDSCNESKHHEKDDETCHFHFGLCSLHVFDNLVVLHSTPTMLGWTIETFITQHTQ